jgi:hypothetical protein
MVSPRTDTAVKAIASRTEDRFFIQASRNIEIILEAMIPKSASPNSRNRSKSWTILSPKAAHGDRAQGPRRGRLPDDRSAEAHQLRELVSAAPGGPIRRSKGSSSPDSLSPARCWTAAISSDSWRRAVCSITVRPNGRPPAKRTRVWQPNRGRIGKAESCLSISASHSVSMAQQALQSRRSFVQIIKRIVQDNRRFRLQLILNNCIHGH